MNPRVAIGIDLGGTYIKAGLVSETGESLGQWKEATGAGGGAAAVMDTLITLTRRIMNSDELKNATSTGFSGSGRPPALVGLGVGSPGIVDPVEGVIKSATGNLPGWKGTRIGPIFEKEFGLRTWLDNDANAYAWGEHHFGAGRGRGARTLLALTLGTGVGGGIVTDGQLFHGAHSCGGEIGHVPVSENDDGPPCSCGNRGCLESYVSAPALVRFVLGQVAEYPGSLIFEMAAGEALSSRHIHLAASRGDTLALLTIERAARYLGRGLAGLVCAFDPDLVVLGGGVANLGDFLFPKVREIVRERVFFSAAAPLEIVPARLGSEAGYLGAAALALFPPSPSGQGLSGGAI